MCREEGKPPCRTIGWRFDPGLTIYGRFAGPVFDVKRLQAHLRCREVVRPQYVGAHPPGCAVIKRGRAFPSQPPHPGTWNARRHFSFFPFSFFMLKVACRLVIFPATNCAPGFAHGSAFDIMNCNCFPELMAQVEEKLHAGTGTPQSGEI